MPNVALRGVPEHMHRRIKDAARANHRSMNGEILVRLAASVSAEPSIAATAVPHEPKRQFGAMRGRLAVDDAFFDPLPEARTSDGTCRLLIR